MIHDASSDGRRPRGRLHLPLFLLAAILLATSVAAAQERYPGETWMRYAAPEEAGWSSERIEGAKALADSIGTAAFMLVHDGAVVATYGDHARRYMCHSVRKSLLSGLYGVYVDEGAIDVESTLADLGIDDRSSLSPVEKQARILDLLRARSGVYHPAAYETAGMAAQRPDRGSHEPGTFWYYNNWDFNTLGAIFRQETGEGVFEAFDRRVADPLGMEDFRLRDGYYHLEPEHSNFPAYPFRMSARDMARFGLLFEREGNWDGEQIIPASWVEASTRPHSDVDRPGLDGYGYMWWILGGELGDRGAYTATGVGTQTITVVPELDVVFVHRVDTYAGDRVRLERIVDLLERLLDARDGDPGPDPELVRLDGPSPGASYASLPHLLLDRYTGTYTYPSGTSLEVSLEEGQLVAHSDRFGTYGLLPLTDRAFLVEDARMTAFFVPTGAGDSVSFVMEPVLSQEGAFLLGQDRLDEAVDVLGRRVEFYPASADAHAEHGEALLAFGDTTTAVRRYRRSLELAPGDVTIEAALVELGVEGFEPVEVGPGTLDAYEGRYRVREGVNFTFTREGDRLLVTTPGSSEPRPAMATSKAVFYMEGSSGPLKLVFVRGDGGEVSGLRVLTWAGTEVWAERTE
jgi:CubicO group peptidase (beta-lactamase class C family)